jgi:hypothetical protein
MKSYGILVPALLAACVASAQTNQLTPAEKKAGWILLFDGKTMDGWVDTRQANPPGDSWGIEDGCLKALKHPKINEDLFTKQTFRDFELEFDWRISLAGNSGIKYRIQDHLFLLPVNKGERFEASVQRSFLARSNARPAKGQDYVIGFEYQITDDSANKDAISNPKHTSGALYDMVPPTTAAARPVGEFNHSRLVVKGNHTEHWLNGVKVVDTMLDSRDAIAGIDKRWTIVPALHEMLAKQPKKDCPISLQNHNDDAWFRNIKIRPLK